MRDENLSDKYLMRLHRFYNQHKRDPLADKLMCGLDIEKRIGQLEYEIYMRTKMKHMVNIQTMLTDLNITVSI